MKFFGGFGKKTTDEITYQQVRKAIESLYSNGLEVVYEKDEEGDFQSGSIFVDDFEITLYRKGAEYCFEAYVISHDDKKIHRVKRVNKIVGDEPEVIYWVYNNPGYEYKIKYYIRNIDVYLSQYKKKKVQQKLKTERKTTNWKP